MEIALKTFAFLGIWFILAFILGCLVGSFIYHGRGGDDEF